MSLTDEQIMACLSHDGDRTAMLNAAYRMGMLRAAEVCEEQGNAKVARWERLGEDSMIESAKAEAWTLTVAAQAIRAEAGATASAKEG